MDKAILQQLLESGHSSLQNYILPGLRSTLLSQPSKEGCVRLFVNSRIQRTGITPHSHRFDIVCQVLRGWVENTIYTRSATPDHPLSEAWVDSTLSYKGTPGGYVVTQGRIDLWIGNKTHYHTGDWYSMTHEDIHSIEFSRDAVVLFFEGPQLTNQTTILEPCVDQKRVPTFKVEPWMFQKPDDDLSAIFD